MGITITPKHNFRNKVNVSGRYPIHLCVYINGKRKYYEVQVPQKVPLCDWTGRSQCWVKITNPFSFLINNEISRMCGAVIELQKRLFEKKHEVTFYHIDKELGFNGNRRIFNDYFKNYMKEPPPTAVLTSGTWEKYNGFISHLDAFNPSIYFDEIDLNMVAHIRNFMAKLKGRKGKPLAPATIKSYFDKFKVVLGHAAKRDGILDIKLVESFFKDVKIAVPPKEEGLHLEISEVRAIKEVVLDEQYPAQDRDRKLFLLQVYTGYYYNDLISLKRKHIRKDFEHEYYIIGERDKNAHATIIHLWKFPDAMRYMMEFKDPDPKSPYWFKRGIFVDVQVYNRSLKTIAKASGVYRPISNKIARHTNIQMWIRMGAERQIVSKMAGHETESTTENYYKVDLREIVQGTANFDFKKLGI